MKTYALLGAAALITSTASATFTSLTVQQTFHAATGRNVYSIYANFTVSNDRILNVFDYLNVSGTMSALHDDAASGDICLDVDLDGYDDLCGVDGSWSPTWGDRPWDSFVAIGAPGPVALAPGFDGGFGFPGFPSFVSDRLANGAGWYDSTPGSQNLAGATLKVKVLQIARLAAGETAYTGRFNVGYAAFGTTTPLFSGNVTYTLPGIPAPGALALLGLAGIVSRRRRA